jgi:UDP-N-acetylmuramoylalanine--D-glutamate ligase
VTLANLAGSRVLVAGLARSGLAACQALVERGANVRAVDGSTAETVLSAAATAEGLGVHVSLGSAAAETVPDDLDLVIASPGWPPHAPLMRAAVERGVPVWGEVELAWRLRAPDAAPWLVVTGTNGKTTTTRMLESMLRADGRRCLAVGNIGVPLVSVVTGEETYDVLAVELGSPQLHSVSTVSAAAATVLNLAPDHIDWHGSFDAYRAAKRVAYDRCRAAAVHNADDPATGALVAEAALQPGCRVVAFTLDKPGTNQLGVHDATLLDRAFGTESDADGVVLADVADVAPAAPHNTANALAAAALARSVGVAPAAVRAGLRTFVPEPHRIALVATVDGVDYVDDSKATNTHAAATSLAAYPSVVWIAGGLAKGGQFDDLVQRHGHRIRAAVLLGTDRAAIVDALERHAPTIPVVEVDGPETSGMSLMDRVVAAAEQQARPGDTVLLAPACASWDQFTDYTARGRAFADAVARLPGAGTERGPVVDGDAR